MKSTSFRSVLSETVKLPLPFWVRCPNKITADHLQQGLSIAKSSYERLLNHFRIDSYGESQDEVYDAIYGNNLEPLIKEPSSYSQCLRLLPHSSPDAWMTAADLIEMYNLAQDEAFINDVRFVCTYLNSSPATVLISTEEYWYNSNDVINVISTNGTFLEDVHNCSFYRINNITLGLFAGDYGQIAIFASQDNLLNFLDSAAFLLSNNN